ncbi:MAG: aspartate kinase [Verrucomicrobiota bacterium]
MPIVVQKYGGSSVANPEKVKQVAKRVVETQELGHSVVVVVSAMGKTTDELLALSKAICPAPERRELDMLLTAGERISMALLSMAIRDAGGESISFTGSQAGILTNDRHVDAKIIEVRPIRVEDELARGKIVIVAGYQGMSYKREITTLGRGGSDTTAVALAAALNAEWCEICSDVDGVYTADPRVVSDAQRIPELSYEETQEMAESGAKVLNAQAVEFAKQAGIAIYARATDGPLPGDDPTRDGTVVRKFLPAIPGSVSGVASEQSISLLNVETDDPSALLSLMDQLEIGAKQVQILRKGSEKMQVSMVISNENLHQNTTFEARLPEQFGDSAHLSADFGAVSVIGTGINTNHHNLVRGINALQGSEIREVFTSSFRITWILPTSEIENAVRSLHAEFVSADES